MAHPFLWVLFEWLDDQFFRPSLVIELALIIIFYEEEQGEEMYRDVQFPMMQASNFNIFQIINFRVYESLPRWEASDPDPIFCKNLFRSPSKIAWHSRYSTVFPHSLRHIALRSITKDDLEELSQILKDPEFDINAAIDLKYGLSALHYAALTNKYPVIEMLLMSGANINQTDGEGNTALMMAVKKEALESINSLMKNGCDRKAVNHYGWKAADKAREAGSRYIAQFIEQYPETSRKFPKFRVRLDVESRILNDKFWDWIKNYKLHSGNILVPPFNNLKGNYQIYFTQSSTLDQNP